MFQYTFKDEDPLEEQYWYHGELTTSDAKRILVNDGDFLVHHENGYLLSAVSKELRYHHFRFQKKNVSENRENQEYNGTKYTVTVKLFHLCLDADIIQSLLVQFFSLCIVLLIIVLSKLLIKILLSSLITYETLQIQIFY